MQHQIHACADEQCVYCRYGYEKCVVCGGVEGELPTECPGRLLTDGERWSISRSEFDYFRDRWWQRRGQSIGTDNDVERLRYHVRIFGLLAFTGSALGLAAILLPRISLWWG